MSDAATADPAGTPIEAPAAPPLSLTQAEAYAASMCFQTGQPRHVGVELEWFVVDPVAPGRATDPRQIIAVMDALGPLPAGGVLTVEPGGQVEISTQPADGLARCVAAATADLTVLRSGFAAAGLQLEGWAVDANRPACRVLDSPRYAAMEAFFDGDGADGRTMMCATASVQVCLDAGEDAPGAQGYVDRWRLAHALGPVLVAAFANSPILDGRPTGWRSTRRAIWSRVDPSRTAIPRGDDPRTAWANYAMNARVLCIRCDGAQPWTAPPGLTFRDWVAGAGPRPPTLDDLSYHLTTLFPPVRPRGWLELRMMDAQPDDGWLVATAVATALMEDPRAAEAARAATSRLGTDDTAGDLSQLWLRAARDALTDPLLADAARACFGAVPAALARLGAPATVQEASEDFIERYVERGRCPADDRLDEWERAGAVAV